MDKLWKPIKFHALFKDMFYRNIAEYLIKVYGDGVITSVNDHFSSKLKCTVIPKTEEFVLHYSGNKQKSIIVLFFFIEMDDV